MHRPPVLASQPLSEAPINVFTQAEAARELGWTPQKLWLSIRMGTVEAVYTNGGTPLVPTAEVQRLMGPRRKTKKSQ